MWADELVGQLQESFQAQADPVRAEAMGAYMKGAAPFLGVGATERRRLLKAAWRILPEPSADDVVVASGALRALPEREFHYAGAEVLGRWRRLLRASSLNAEIRDAVLTVPWWDTVDLLGTAVINPMVAMHPALVGVMWQWNGEADQWLIRASIQHQRGSKDPDLDLLFALCAVHTSDQRFFVAKAIGWALRDAARHDAAAVQRFAVAHPELSAVAMREVRRGIERACKNQGSEPSSDAREDR
jgi:3-methyladenine DNA glycosylase AlkD